MKHLSLPTIKLHKPQSYIHCSPCIIFVVLWPTHCLHSLRSAGASANVSALTYQSCLLLQILHSEFTWRCGDRWGWKVDLSCESLTSQVMPSTHTWNCLEPYVVKLFDIIFCFHLLLYTAFGALIGNPASLLVTYPLVWPASLQAYNNNGTRWLDSQTENKGILIILGQW